MRGGWGTGLCVSAHVAFVWVDLETSEALLVWLWWFLLLYHTPWDWWTSFSVRGETAFWYKEGEGKKT